MTTTKLTPDDVTPDLILGIANARGLRLIPHAYITRKDGTPVGCCPAGALAIEARPEVLESGQSVLDAFAATGLSESYRYGLRDGFDVPSRKTRTIPGTDYEKGAAVGRAVRMAAMGRATR